MLTQELLAEGAVIATQALSAGPAFRSRSAAVALVCAGSSTRAKRWSCGQRLRGDDRSFGE